MYELMKILIYSVLIKYHEYLVFGFNSYNVVYFPGNDNQSWVVTNKLKNKW